MYRNNYAWRLLCKAKFVYMRVDGQNRYVKGSFMEGVSSLKPHFNIFWSHVSLQCLLISTFFWFSFQGYDPDLPPELAAAAGIHDIPNEHTLGKSDGLQNDVGKGVPRVRPPLVFTMFYHSCDMQKWTINPFYIY